MNREILFKKDSLLAASYHNLLLTEHRFLFMAAGGIYKDEKVSENTKCKVYIERYAKEFNISVREATSQAKKIKESLKDKRVILQSYLENPVPWVRDIELVCNDEINVIFHKEIIPYMFGLTGGFIKYGLDVMKNMNSINSIRLYEICKTVDYEKSGRKLNIEVDELKRMLSVEEKYSQYGSFQRMLDTSIKEINRVTDINVDLVERKLGKKVISLVFLVTINQIDK